MDFFNSRLKGYTAHKARIDYPEGYHLVSDASTYEMVLYPGYQNPYEFNIHQALTQMQHPLVQGQHPQAQGSQAQAQESQGQAKEQPGQEAAGINAEELASKIWL